MTRHTERPEEFQAFLEYTKNAQGLFAEFLTLLHALSTHGSNHVVPPGTPGPTLELPFGPCEVTAYIPKRPLPHDFFDRRIELKKSAFKKWGQIADFIRRRYTRYGEL